MKMHLNESVVNYVVLDAAHLTLIQISTTFQLLSTKIAFP